MNNNQFRRLVLAQSERLASGTNVTATGDKAAGKLSLGSRQRAGTPLTTAHSLFARQLAERNQAARPPKSIKTSLPKGTKLASGYVDRAKARLEEDAKDREEILEALKQALSKGKVDRETYDKLRLETASGLLVSAHRLGKLKAQSVDEACPREDDDENTQTHSAQDDVPKEDDVDEALDEFERREVHAIEKERKEKKRGQFAMVSAVSGKKRTRDQILADLKASREAADKPKVSLLDSRFRPIGSKHTPGMRIERDGHGREVLIIVDEDGREKRKVRKLQAGDEDDDAVHGLSMPNPRMRPLNLDMKGSQRENEAECDEVENDDGDIFADVGDDYDPLASLSASEPATDSDSDMAQGRGKEEDSQGLNKGPIEKETSAAPDAEAMPCPPKPAAPRNYFERAKTGLMSRETTQGPSMSDPAIMAVIKRAAALRPVEGKDRGGDGSEADAQKDMEKRRKELQRMNERDDDDIDLGFGTSRYEDEEDLGDERVKLSVWGDEADGADGRGRSGQANKRKRGPKKRKGDKNSAADVLRVMEQRKRA